jgi:hypothetical protein
MSSQRFALGTALALLGLLAATPRADAAYTYTASLMINSVTTGGTTTNTPTVGATFTSTNGTTVTLGDIGFAAAPSGSFLVGSPLSANIGNITVTTTSTTPDTFSINYSDFGSLTNPSPGGSTITAQTSGVLTFTGIQNVGGAFSGTVSNQFTGPFMVGPSPVIGGAVFFISVGMARDEGFSPPIVGNTKGNLGALITSSVIPEPSSVVMLGLGLVGVAGIGLRRRP